MSLRIENLSKAYGANQLFENINLNLNYNEKLGIVGRNGHGKSTLIKIIIGEQESDSGNIYFPDDYKIGYLSQHLKFTEKNILDEACLALEQFDEYIDETYKAKAILQGLGFSDEMFEQTPESLSGGFQVRLNLAKLLISNPNLLLLDEPTNYLDIVSTRWLIGFLQKWDGEVILITHDRNFMDSICTHIAGIHRSSLKKIKGQTDNYYNLISGEEEIHEKTRLNQLKKREETEKFVERFRAKASKAKAVQSRVKALDKQEVLEELQDIEQIDFKFNYSEFRGKFVLRAENLSFSYPDSEILFKDISLFVQGGEKIAVIGKNGKGKSTLLKVLAEELKSNTGNVEYSTHTKIGFFGQTNVLRLNPEDTIETEILNELPEYNRTIARSIAGSMLFSGDSALKKIEVLSGGEKSRVLLAKILAKKTNLLMLDEPTHHLDIQSNQVLTRAIKSFEGAVIFVTHDEDLLHAIATKLIVFDNNTVSLFDGTYQDFLDRIGWYGEDTDNKPKKKAEKKLSKKEKRQLAAKELQNKNSGSNKIKKLETQIIKLEDELKIKNEKLIELTKDGFGENAEELMKEIDQKKSSLDKLMDEYDKLS